MFYADVARGAIEFEAKREDIVTVRRITDDERTIQFVLQDFFRSLTTNGAPVPSILKANDNFITLELKV